MHRLLVLCLVFLGCIVVIPSLYWSGPAAQTLQPARPPGPPLYIIQPNDVLQIFVYGEPPLTGPVLVRPDGRIALPLVQDIQAAGLNPGELKLQIEEAIKEYVKVPNVTVIVQTIQSYRVFVMGKVQRPGAIMEVKPINVLQALTLAGGFVEYANKEDISIVRGTGEDSKKFHFNYSQVEKGENYSQNIFLRAGDVVLVP